MRVLSMRPGRCLAVALAAQLALISPAHAASSVLINSQMLALFQAIGTPNICVTYTYDLNGNRKTQNSMLWGAPGTTWGSAIYGCFSWTP